MKKQTLILASSSPHRFELLSRLKIPFIVVKPETDESIIGGEKPCNLVLRLAEQKARDALRKYQVKQEKNSKNIFVIGSDQVLEVGNKIFGKPHNKENASKQLSFFSGKKATFHTSVCLLSNQQDLEIQSKNIKTKIEFDALTEQKIRHYLGSEDALNCAGSFKSEGLGLSLLQKIKSTDHSAIIGLPLITLCEMLEKSGFNRFVK